jgi:4-amino-4-deoxy-L-arabinose transferase-like glycosyltransferase
LPLLLINGEHQSLMPYDEGYYAIQARWIWESGDWLTPQWWGLPIYDRTIGLQWLIALAYHLFGLNEFSVRLPSTIACIISVLLTYEVGKILFDRQIAWLGAAILMLMGLWVSEAHTAQQNTALVAIELLGIWALLKIADSQSTSLSPSGVRLWAGVSILRWRGYANDRSWLWGLLAGASVGWGFLLKGFMIFVPMVALLPYAIDRQRYQKFLTNPGIYIGLIFGALPTGLWLILSCVKYGGLMPVQELINKLLFLSQTDTYNPGPFYYLWNLPLNIFPWALFSAIGAIVVWRKLLPINYATISLTLGYPIVLFILLSLFRTRMAYYTMQLLPLMALLSATAFVQFGKVGRQQLGWYRLVTWLGYAFSGLGLILAVAGILVAIFSVASPFLWNATRTENRPLWGLVIPPEIRIYALPAIALGGGWMTIVSLWRRWQSPANPFWLAGWLLPAWMAIVGFGLQGALTDKSPDFRMTFDRLMTDRAVVTTLASSLDKQPVNLLIDNIAAEGFGQHSKQDRALTTDEHKTLILLSFYTPHLGKQLSSFTDLPDRSYAWTLGVSSQLANRTRVIGKVQGWQLIQKISNAS